MKTFKSFVREEKITVYPYQTPHVDEKTGKPIPHLDREQFVTVQGASNLEGLGDLLIPFAIPKPLGGYKYIVMTVAQVKRYLATVDPAEQCLQSIILFGRPCAFFVDLDAKPKDEEKKILLEKALAPEGSGIQTIMRQLEALLHKFCALHVPQLGGPQAPQDWGAARTQWLIEPSTTKASLHFHATGLVFDQVTSQKAFIDDFVFFMQRTYRSNPEEVDALCVPDSSGVFYHLLDAGIYTAWRSLRFYKQCKPGGKGFEQLFLKNSRRYEKTHPA